MKMVGFWVCVCATQDHTFQPSISDHYAVSYGMTLINHQLHIPDHMLIFLCKLSKFMNVFVVVDVVVCCCEDLQHAVSC
jgi:hypothetical protein